MESDKLLLQALRGRPTPRPPLWLMRQAGRYLPEYRAIRGRVGGFLDFCYTPELAEEVTLQPIRRFGFDAAILFSDILVVPHALGVGLRFVEGEGPQLDAVQDAAGIVDRLERSAARRNSSPVYETLRRLRRALPTETALIGFAGAPWTLAAYMVEGGGSQATSPWRERWPGRSRARSRRLIDILVATPSSSSSTSRSRPVPRRCSCSTAGPGCCHPASSTLGASRPTGGSSSSCAAGIQACRSSAFRAAPAPATPAFAEAVAATD